MDKCRAMSINTCFPFIIAGILFSHSGISRRTDKVSRAPRETDEVDLLTDPWREVPVVILISALNVHRTIKPEETLKKISLLLLSFLSQEQALSLQLERHQSEW